MNWLKKIFGSYPLNKEEFKSIWIESSVVTAFVEVTSQRNLPIEQYFAMRVNYSASKCSEKFGLSKSRFITYLKQYEGISDKEFNELY